MTTTPLRITVWGENVHEQVEQHVAERYPDGMHGAIADGIRENLPDAVVRDLPAWETLPHERLSPSAETVGRRLSVLRDAADWDGRTPLVVTASVRGALQPIAAGLTDAGVVRLELGSRGQELDDIVHRLVDLAYHRVVMVSR